MLTRSEIREALLARGAQQEDLFAMARAAREDALGPVVVLRGVIEIGNVCRVNCLYCPMRKDNTMANDRYVLGADAIVERAAAIKDAGIDVVLLQSGETSAVLPVVEKAIPRILDLFDGRVEVLLNLGNLRFDQYERLRRAGARSYILKQETSDPDLHHAMRLEPLHERLRRVEELLRLGFRVGIGFISDLPGQTLDSIVDDIELPGRLGVHMSSVSPFVPAPGTPLDDVPAGSVDLALNALACLRIQHPHLLVPAVSALEKNATGGQSRGLAAGANVMTINFTSEADLGRYLIYGKDRFVVRQEHARGVAARAGLSLRGSIFLDQQAALGVAR